jgi:hypothetical protein
VPKVYVLPGGTLVLAPADRLGLRAFQVESGTAGVAARHTGSECDGVNNLAIVRFVARFAVRSHLVSSTEPGHRQDLVIRGIAPNSVYQNRRQTRVGAILQLEKQNS